MAKRYVPMWPLIPKAVWEEFPKVITKTSRGLMMYGYGQPQVDEEKSRKAFSRITQDIMQQPEDKRATSLKSDPRFWLELNIQSQLQKQMEQNIKEK